MKYKKFITLWKRVILGCVLYIYNTCADPYTIDKIVAVVDNTIILESELRNILIMLTRNAQQDDQQLPGNIPLRFQILDKLIIDNIILQLAQRTNIVVSNQKLDQTIENIAKQHHMTINQLCDRLHHDGIDFNTYREQIKKEILITEMYNNIVRNRLTVLPQEINILAQQISMQNRKNLIFELQHIFVNTPENMSKDQLDKAETLATFLVEKSKHDIEFEELSITYSSELQVLKGKIAGWKRLEELPSIFVVHLKDAEKGDIIGPIRSDIGFHILKVNNVHYDEQKIMVTEFHVRHILLRESILMTDQQAYTKLQDISKKIRNSYISFGDAARQLSEDLYSAKKGGDMGWHSINEFEPEFRNILTYLKIGEISIPVHTSFGWHLIQIIETRQVDRTNEINKNRAYELLLKRKAVSETRNWIQEKRASTYVKIIE